MNQHSGLKPQVQLICERLIDRFASRLQEDNSVNLPKEIQEEFIRVWREGTAARLWNQSLSFLQAESSLPAPESCGSADEESSSPKRRRIINPSDSDDEFEGAKVDSVGVDEDCDEKGVYLSQEEAAFLREHGLAPPPLDDLSELPPEKEPKDKIIGQFDKVSRPADSSRPLAAERSAAWSFIIRDGLIKIAGQEFALERLDAELKEV